MNTDTMTREELLFLAEKLRDGLFGLYQDMVATDTLLAPQYRPGECRRIARQMLDLARDGEITRYPPREDVPFDYQDLNHLLPFLEQDILTQQEIDEVERAQKWLVDLIDDKTGKEHVDVKVKTLSRALWPHRFTTHLAKASRSLLELMKMGKVQ